MRNNKISISFVLIACFLASSMLYCAHAAQGSGAAFLKIAPGARAVSMGSAFTALSNDISALHFNPAGLNSLAGKEVGLMHAQLYLDTNFDFIGYAHPINRNNTLGFGAVSLSQGTIEGRGDNRERVSGFTASDYAFTMSYSRSMADALSAGASFKIIKSQIANATANGFAMDLGTIWNTPLNNLAMGLTARNLGPKMKFYDEPYNLPLVFSAGAAYAVPLGISLAVDVSHMPYENKQSISFGTEYMASPNVALRAGYLLPLAAQLGNKTNIPTNSFAPKGLDFGFGLNAFGTRMDYAIVSFGELGNTHRLSLGFKF
ncbi:PorV/PorQ family protein [Elusimicrobiota bacterium]